MLEQIEAVYRSIMIVIVAIVNVIVIVIGIIGDSNIIANVV